MAAKTARRNSLKSSGGSSSLKRLSDGDLIARLERARGTERAVQKRIVCDLAEVERRRLYLPLGYGSLFEFCTDYLKYSRSSAWRRISAARCIARFPRMAELYRRGECDLTVLSTVAGVVTRENCAEIARWLRGKSLREVEAFAARRQPARSVRDQVRQIYVMSVKPADAHGNGAALPEAGVAPGNGADPRKGTVPAVVDTGSRNGTEHTGVDESQCTEPTPRNGASLPVVYAGNAGPEGVTKCTVHRTFTPSAGSEMAQPATNKSLENQGVRPGSGGGSSSAIRSPGIAPTVSLGVAPAERIVVERKFKLQFAVDPEFMEKLNKIKSLLSTKYPKGMDFQTLFDILMTEYLERHSPEIRIKKRELCRENKKNNIIAKGENERNGKPVECERDTGSRKRQSVNGAVKKKTEKRRSAATKRRSGDAKERSGVAKKRPAAARARHIPQSMRDQVFVRDGGRCTFVGKNGKRCKQTWNLEIDHVIPFAKGGDNSPENLRLLCAKHNRLEAEREYGTDHMEKFYRRE